MWLLYTILCVCVRYDIIMIRQQCKTMYSLYILSTYICMCAAIDSKNQRFCLYSRTECIGIYALLNQVLFTQQIYPEIFWMIVSHVSSYRYAMATQKEKKKRKKNSLTVLKFSVWYFELSFIDLLCVQNFLFYLLHLELVSPKEQSVVQKTKKKN